MRNATDLMVAYAAYHRDQRNIATHYVGVPMMVFSLAVLLSRPTVVVGGYPVSPAMVFWALTALWYLTRGNLGLALAVSAMNFMIVMLALPVGTLSTPVWLTLGVGLFLAGWLVQSVGHYYEGRKPVYLGHPSTLLTAPMFVAAEALFAAGWGRSLVTEIERRVGPTHLRDLHAHATR